MWTYCLIEEGVSMPVLLQIILGICAPVIAGFAAYIGYRQWQLGQYKLKHDLFERRWIIYASSHDALAYALNGSSSEKLDSFKELRRKIVSANFLFPLEICDYLNEIATNISKLGDLEQKIPKTSDDRELLTKDHADVYRWLEKQPSILTDKFRKYLDLSI